MEIPPVKAILCRFALHFFLCCLSICTTGIFKCTGEEELVYYIHVVTYLILHGMSSM